MKALTYHGKRDVRIDEHPDPTIQEPTDAIIRVTSTAICGSDLHLYDVLGPFLDAGDILGHEPMGVVEEVGSHVKHIKAGDRVVIPFNISCGTCFMCDKSLYSQCETTQVHEYDSGAALLGFSKLYGQVPGGQAEFLRVPQAHFGPIKVPDDAPDERFLYLSDVLPTAWQGVLYAGVPDTSATVAVFGLGPIGQMACRIAQYQGARVIGVDDVPERLALAQQWSVETLDRSTVDDVGDALREMTGGRGPESVIDAVGMEAHGGAVNTAAKVVQTVAGALPDAVAKPIFQNVGTDRTTALVDAIDAVRRGGTVSISGVYGGTATPLNMMQLFDKQLTVRMGQANVKHHIEALWPLLTDPKDPLGTESFATHRIPLADAPAAYETFQKKQDGAIKMVIKP